MPDVSLSTALDQIQGRSAAALEFPQSGFAEDSIRACTQSALDVPRLLAALRAVLELHQSVDRGTGARCKGCATHATFTRWPCPTYLAITRELNGGGDE